MKYYRRVFACLVAISVLVMLLVAPVFYNLFDVLDAAQGDALIRRLDVSVLPNDTWGAGRAFIPGVTHDPQRNNNIRIINTLPANSSSTVSKTIMFLEELAKNSISLEHRDVPPYEPDTRTRYLVHLLEHRVMEHFGCNIERMTDEFTKSGGEWGFTLRKGDVLSLKFNKTEEDLTTWEQFHAHIQQFALYDPSTGVVDRLMYAVANLPIINATEKTGGTQLKMIVTLSNKGAALLKPQRFAHDYETADDHFYFTDFERHFSEIASFHLDRVLGYYRAPPVVGRWINITSDLKRYATKALRKTFFTSPANNMCFHGICKYYCDVPHAICGRPDHVEVSMAAFLPKAKIKHVMHPWRRTYRASFKATWEKQDSYCTDLKKKSAYREGRRLLDLMDLAVLDFLIGNMDRHHYVTFKQFGNFTSLIHWDHGRGFGKAFVDEMSILTPIRQCCQIRYTTLVKLLVLYHSPQHLSGVMRKSLERDLLPSILTEAHLVALDRRLPIILATITKCLQDGHKLHKVVRNDGF